MRISVKLCVWIYIDFRFKYPHSCNIICRYYIHQRLRTLTVIERKKIIEFIRCDLETTESTQIILCFSCSIVEKIRLLIWWSRSSYISLSLSSPVRFRVRIVLFNVAVKHCVNTCRSKNLIRFSYLPFERPGVLSLRSEKKNKIK